MTEPSPPDEVTSQQAGAAGGYALLADGGTVRIRPAGPQDADAVRELHAAMSPDNLYLRFFSLSPMNAQREADRVCRPPEPGHVALIAWLGASAVGVASFEVNESAQTAEVAFAVADTMHRHGVAALLLDHLVSIARQREIVALTAQTLAENSAMLAVFTAAGLPVRRHWADGVAELTIPLPAGESDASLTGYLDAVQGRESHADVASLRRLFSPDSVAVVGASRRRNSVGAQVLRNIVAGGFAGRVYPVNPHAGTLEGLPCVASAAELPAGVDVAIVAVPAAGVVDVAEQCGRRGVRVLVVITAGLGSSGPSLLAACRRHGMRLVGPNCFGIAIPGSGLDATFGRDRPVPGIAGVAVQSGGIGVSLTEHLSRLGVGVSSFISMGDKYDVSANDLLTWWQQDERTSMAVLYLESFGNPRKFARTARRVSGRMPVLTLMAGRSADGQRAAQSHTAAAATPTLTREALFGQAGIILTASLGELIGAAAFLSCQPYPAGHRVAVVTNAGGAGVLAADACSDAGLMLAPLAEATRQRLAALLPADATIANPLDTSAGVDTDVFRCCLEAVAADEGIDAVISVTVPTAMADLSQALAAAVIAKPLSAALLDQAETVRLLPRAAAAPVPGDSGLISAVPCYAYPEDAVRALSHAARYGAWRSRPPGRVPELSGVRSDDARLLVGDFLREHPPGGWLPASAVRELLDCYRIPQAATVIAGTEQEAMLSSGVEILIGVAQEPVFGSLVVFGPGGVDADLLGDHRAALTPLTDADARELIHGVRAVRLLEGYRGMPAADLEALADVLLRVSRLADDLPEVSALDLNPVIARADGCLVADARARVVPAGPHDPFLRVLPGLKTR